MNSTECQTTDARSVGGKVSTASERTGTSSVSLVEKKKTTAKEANRPLRGGFSFNGS